MNKKLFSLTLLMLSVFYLTASASVRTGVLIDATPDTIKKIYVDFKSRGPFYFYVRIKRTDPTFIENQFDSSKREKILAKIVSGSGHIDSIDGKLTSNKSKMVTMGPDETGCLCLKYVPDVPGEYKLVVSMLDQGVVSGSVTFLGVVHELNEKKTEETAFRKRTFDSDLRRIEYIGQIKQTYKVSFDNEKEISRHYSMIQDGVTNTRKDESGKTTWTGTKKEQIQKWEDNEKLINDYKLWGENGSMRAYVITDKMICFFDNTTADLLRGVSFESKVYGLQEFEYAIIKGRALLKIQKTTHYNCLGGLISTMSDVFEYL